MSIGETRVGSSRRRAASAASIMLACVVVLGGCGGTSATPDDTVSLARPSVRSPDGGAAGNPTSLRPQPTSAAAPRAGARRTILFVGTSITAGLGLEPDSAFPQMIDRKLDSLGLPYDAVNAGVSGETSAGLLRRIDWLLRAPFDIVVLETGANDGLRGTPIATVRSNIQQIINRTKAARPNATILLVRMEALPNFGEDYTSQFRAMFPDLAERNGLTLLPFLLEGVAGHASLNQPDGIHPNLAGERIVADNVWRSLRPILERDQRRRP